MSKKDEALKQALEAAYLAGFKASGEGYNGEYPFDANNPENDAVWLKDRDNAIQEALAEQPAQQEPVAWMDGYRNIYSLEEKAAGCPEATIALVPMANHKKTSGSPIKELNCICGAVWEGDELVHLPRPPAQRKPLTDGWILGMWPDTGFPHLVLKFARAIEAAHGIKGDA